MRRDDAVELLRPFEYTEMPRHPPRVDIHQTNRSHDRPLFVSPVGNLFGAYSTGGLLLISYC